MTDKPRGNWFQTFTGKQFYVLDPRPEDVCIEDIAHHLSLICRFNGATVAHYSVAQHSVLVADSLPEELRLWGALHDAAEAYIGDMVRPLKLEMPAYKEVEVRIERVIAERFGLVWPISPEVKVADNRALATERRDLLAHKLPWSSVSEPFANRIQPWSAGFAEKMLLAYANAYHDSEF